MKRDMELVRKILLKIEEMVDNIAEHNLEQRGEKPFIQWIDESKWDKVMKIFCALCEAYEKSPTDMFQQTVPLHALAGK